MRALPTPEGLCRFKVPFPYVPPPPPPLYAPVPLIRPFPKKAAFASRTSPSGYSLIPRPFYRSSTLACPDYHVNKEQQPREELLLFEYEITLFGVDAPNNETIAG